MAIGVYLRTAIYAILGEDRSLVNSIVWNLQIIPSPVCLSS